MKRILILTWCFTFLGIGSVLAQLNLSRHSFELGPEISYIRYEEPNLMVDKGGMYGMITNYTFRPNFIVLKAETKWALGKVDYESPESGTIDGKDEFMLELRGLGGYDFSLLRTTILTPYTGLGYRYLSDNADGMTSSAGQHGYERESKYFYSPIGIKTITELGNQWSFGLKGEYDHFWGGVQKTYLSDVLSGFNDLENEQKKGYGIKGSIEIQKKITSSRSFFIIQPFVTYWNIKESEKKLLTFYDIPIGLGVEPKNNSLEIGSKIGVIF